MIEDPRGASLPSRAESPGGFISSARFGKLKKPALVNFAALNTMGPDV